MAGNSEKIDEIVDRAAVGKQLDDTTTQVVELEARLVDTAKGAALLNAELAKSGNFKIAADNATKAAAATTKLQQEEAKLLALQEKLRQATVRREQDEAKLENLRATNADKEQKRQAKATADIAKQSGAYNQLLAVYRKVTEEARNAGVQFGTNSYQFRELSNQANGLRTRLDGIDQPLGNFQRNVGNYASGLGTYFTKLYGYIRVAANIIPGLGISGIFLLAYEGLKKLVDLLPGMNDGFDAARTRFSAFAAALKDGEVGKTATDFYNLSENFKLASQGFLSKKEVLKEYNDTLGKTLGFTDNFNIAEERTLKNGAKVIQLTLFKAAAQEILKKAVDKTTEGIEDQNKSDDDTITFGDRVKQAFSFTNGIFETEKEFDERRKKEIPKFAKDRRAILATENKKDVDQLLKSFDDAQKLAAKYAKDNKLDFFQDDTKPDKPKKVKDDSLSVLNDRLEQAGRIRDKTLQDENSTYDDRIQALNTFEHDSSIIIEQAERAKTITRLDSDNRLLKISNESDKARLDQAKKAQSDLLKALKDGAAQDEATQKEILKNSLDVESQFTEKRKTQNQNDADDALIGLAEQYGKGLISAGEYAQKKADIERQNQLDLDQIVIDGLRIRIGIEESLGADTLEDRKKLEEAQRKLSKDTANSQIADAEAVADRKKKLAAAEKQFGDDLFNFAQTVTDAQYTNALNEVQKEKDLLDERTKSQIDAENRSLDSTQDKADKIAIINAQAQSQQDALDKKARDLKTKQAKTDRLFTIAKIIETTALAVISALAPPPIGLGPLLGVPLAAVTAGIGAVQIATVLATPIPAYEKGTKSAKGGLSIWGEKGTELAIEPSGRSYLSPDKATLTNIPAGTQIIPHMELMGAIGTERLKAYSGGQQVPWREVIAAIKESKPRKQKPPVVNGWLRENNAAGKYDAKRKNHFR